MQGKISDYIGRGLNLQPTKFGMAVEMAADPDQFLTTQRRFCAVIFRIIRDSQRVIQCAQCHNAIDIPSGIKRSVTATWLGTGFLLYASRDYRLRP